MKKIFLPLLIIVGCVFYLTHKLDNGFGKKHSRNAEIEALAAEESAKEEPSQAPTLSSNLSEVIPGPTPESLSFNPTPTPSYESPAQSSPPMTGLARCETPMMYCRHKEVIFRYPSESFPSTPESDAMIMTCITDVQNCDQSRGIDPVTEEEEMQELNSVPPIEPPQPQEQACPWPVQPDGSCQDPETLNPPENEQSQFDNNYPQDDNVMDPNFVPPDQGQPQ